MNRTAVLGVSGSVAAYRAADLARELMRNGFTVRVCLTDSAAKFVSAALFEALTGQPCLIDAFDEPERGRMAHIDWARAASIIVIAPATANTIARLAHGVGDDMLTTLCLASEAPMLIAPAMNPTMYASDTNRAAMAILAERGAVIVEPSEGDVACGENGQGKLASVEAITRQAVTLANLTQLWQGKNLLITSGATREPIDSVRFLSNRSSGRMGAAVARAAMMMGAQVTVVSGHTEARLPLKAKVLAVSTALEMLEAAKNELSTANLVIGVAAVADYRPANYTSGKLRRTNAPTALDLIPNPDVIRELAGLVHDRTQCRVIGFAAEPSSDLDVARAKLDQKQLDGIAVNDVSNPAVGFESRDNALTLLRPGRPDAFSGQQGKLGCAIWLLSQLAN